MADLRSSFTVLEDVASQIGRPLHAAVENDAAAGKNAHGVLAGKDPSGNLRYLKVNDAGEAVVSLESAEQVSLNDDGTNAGSATFVDLAVIPLQNDFKYRTLGVIVSCFRDAIFRVVWNDNGVETVLVRDFRCGAGALNVAFELAKFKLTAGSTGTQELKIRGMNLGALSTLDATLTTEEDQT